MVRNKGRAGRGQRQQVGAGLFTSTICASLLPWNRPHCHKLQPWGCWPRALKSTHKENNCGAKQWVNVIMQNAEKKSQKTSTSGIYLRSLVIRNAKQMYNRLSSVRLDLKQLKGGLMPLDG